MLIHRITDLIEAGRNLWVHLVLSLIKQPHPEQIPNRLGSLCQSSFTLTVKKCFLMFEVHLLYLCPLPLVLAEDTTDKSF